MLFIWKIMQIPTKKIFIYDNFRDITRGYGFQQDCLIRGFYAEN